MLSAIILIFFNRTCAKIDKFSQNGSIFFYLDTIRQKECENQLNTVIQNFERVKLLITSSKY